MSSTFNIVDFIESNPLAQLSDTYNSRLLQKIKGSFTEDEQKLYITSFYGYLHYSKQDFVINLDNIWCWLGFSMKQSAKRVIIKHFIENTDYKISLNNLVERSNSVKGGENKVHILLTINAFKKLCLKAGTKKADNVHDYFIKLEEIMHEVVKEECEELKQKIEGIETKNTELETDVETLKYTNERDHHSLLCQYNDKTRLVYVLKMKTLLDGSFVIKIGETNDIKQRCQAISCDFGIKVTIMDLFPCDLNYEFERFLHSHPILTRHKYTDPICNGKKSTETYLMSNMKAYNKIKQFIQRNGIRFHSKNAENIKYTAINNIITTFKDDKDKLEEMLQKITANSTVPVKNEQYNELEKQTSSMIDELVDAGGSNQRRNSSILHRKASVKRGFPTENLGNVTNCEAILHVSLTIDNEMNTIIENAIVENTVPIQEPPKSKPNIYSPKVQIYDPHDLKNLVKVFESITEATRGVENTSFSHIKFAARNKIIYKNYRWHLISWNDPHPHEAKEIGATKESNQNKMGFVAMLNNEKNKVFNVFTLQKEAANYCNTHTSLISSAIRYGTTAAGYSWVLWDELDDEVKNDYLRLNILPTITCKTRGFRVQKINPQSDEIEQEYPSMTDATKENKISVNSIRKSSMQDIVVSGYKWKIVHSP